MFSGLACTGCDIEALLVNAIMNARQVTANRCIVLGVLTLKAIDMSGRRPCLSRKPKLSYADLDERSLRSLAEHVLTRKCRLLRDALRESFAAVEPVGHLVRA